MYQTHRYQGKNSKDYIGIGDPYSKKAKINPSYKGRQFQTNPPYKGQTRGYFAPVKYSGNPYQTTKRYLASQPRDKRNLGFGSKDAHKRDEFTADIRARQYREKLKTEASFAKANMMQNRPQTAPELMDGETLEDMRQREYQDKYEDGPPQTQVPFSLYDIGRTQNTEFNPKSHKDTFYHIHTAARSGARRPGPSTTSYETYGNFDVYPCKRPQYGSVSETKTFYDHSHLST